MNRRERERYIVSLDRKRRLTEMAESKPPAKAAKAFIRKAYECCDVTEYMARKYNVKRNIRIGQESSREDLSQEFKEKNSEQ